MTVAEPGTRSEGRPTTPWSWYSDPHILERELERIFRRFNVLPGHPNLSIGPVWPTGPTTCEGYLDYWFGDEADAQWIDDLFVLDTQVGAEDTALVEAAQRGSASGMIDRGWVLGATETLIGHFQDWVRGQTGLDQGGRA